MLKGVRMRERECDDNKIQKCYISNDRESDKKKKIISRHKEEE